jgi:hypothetical protein
MAGSVVGRIRPDYQQIGKTFPSPAKTMSFAFSPDGKRILAFRSGQDVLTLDAADGRVPGKIPYLWQYYGGAEQHPLPVVC